MSLRKIDLEIRLRGSKRLEENRTVKGIGTVKNALTLKGEKQKKRVQKQHFVGSVSA